MAEIPVLSEHQSHVLNTTNPTEYTPSTEERRALKLVNSLFDKAKKHRKKYDEHWPEYYKMFRGKQWAEQRPSYRHSEVINFIFQAIQSVVPVMTDARQRFDFLPEEPQDIELAEILSEVAESDWQRGNWLMKLTENLYDSHILGTGMGGMEFNPKARDGMGAIEFTADDPFYCFPDPASIDVNEKSRFFITAEPVDVGQLKREYPSKRHFIKPDLIDLMQGDRTDLDQVRFKSPVDSRTVTEGGNPHESEGRDQALKITCYLVDDSFEEEEKERQKEDGTVEKYYEQKLKYPNGRKICIAGGVVLEDGPNPYEDGLFPKARLVNYILPREFWGMSEVEQLKSPQKIFNKLVSFSLDVLTLMGNPIWMVPNTAGIDTDNLFNRPGLIVEYDGENKPTREEGVQLQPYVLQLIDRMVEWFDGIAGRGDVTQGTAPTGVTAGNAIIALQEAAQTRIRQKSRNMDAYLQNLGQLYKNRVFQFYTVPRIARLTSKEGANKYFKFHIEHQEQPDGGSQKVAYLRNYTKDANGNFTEDLKAKEFIMKGDFDVRVATGSALPFAKSEKSNLAFKLKEFGAIDELELLLAVEYPNAEAVWQRVQDRMMQRAQEEAAAAAPPPPEGAPAGPPPPPPQAA